MSSDLLIISPLFYGHAGGASVYYRLLANSLMERNFSVSIISEKSEGDFDGEYIGLFPAWAGKDRRLIRDYISYFYQNIQYFRISSVIKKVAPKTVLVHSSFFNHPGLFRIILKAIIKKNPHLHYVADVRDRLLPARRIKELDIFDSIIACSENVKNHLRQNGISEKKIVLIPVIQEQIELQKKQLIKTLKNYNLNGIKYILYVGAVKEDKAVDILLESFLKHVRGIRPDVDLVLIGLMKTENLRLKALIKSEGIHYLGNLSRDETLAVMKAASLCVNLSPNEGMPRVSLEAIALKKSVILPPNIPEFIEFCSSDIVESRDIRIIGQKIREKINKEHVTSYPIENHYPNKVLPMYENTLELKN